MPQTSPPDDRPEALPEAPSAEIQTEEFVVPPPVPQGPLHLVRPMLPVTAALIAAVVALYVLMPLVPEPGANVQLLRIGAYASVGVFFLLIGGIVLSLRAAALWPARLLGIATVVALCGVIAGNLTATPVATDLMKLLFATGIGFLLAKLIQDVLWAPVSAVAIAIADSWSVFAERGVARTIVEQHPEAVPWATIAVPAATFAYGDAMLLGIVDLVFLSMFLVIAWGWGLGMWRNFFLLSLSFLVTIIIDVELLSGAPVPALPVLSLTFVAVNAPAFWRVWRGRRRQRPPAAG